jgi:phosphoribosyl 1,2-cyclic phosphodiesterase
MGAFLRFWGVRGSIPTPSLRMARFGGNTSCVEFRAGADRVILDAGTGIRDLGMSLGGQSGLHLSILFTHYHWDHMLGLPFFWPLFNPANTVSLHGERKPEGGPREALQRQFCSPHFPVEFERIGAKLDFHEVGPGDEFHVGRVRVRVGRLTHPQGSLAYRLEAGRKALVYATDHEHGSDPDEGLVALAKKADALVYDAMYTNESYGQGKKGWGHSTWQQAVHVAQQAGVKRLFLFHHDPTHDDKTLASIERAARKAFPGVSVAREGEEVTL